MMNGVEPRTHSIFLFPLTVQPQRQPFPRLPLLILRGEGRKGLRHGAKQVPKCQTSLMAVCTGSGEKVRCGGASAEEEEEEEERRGLF